MDDNLNEEELQKQKEQEANTKTAHVAGKAAATYFGGAAGNKIYDAVSNTEVGKRIEQAAGSALQQSQLLNKASQKLNDSGALDAADKGIDLASANKDSVVETSGLPKEKGLTDNTSDNQKETEEENSSNSNNSNGEFSFFDPKSKKKIMIITPLATYIIIFLVVLIAVATIFQPIINASNYVQGIWSGFIDFITGTTEEQRLEEEFYKTLQDTQTSINREHNVCIDVNLITATLTAYTTFDKFLEEGEQITDEVPDGSENPYKKMTKQIRLLANMQMKTSNYILDENADSYCLNTETTIPITTGDKNSSTPELIAKNDMTGIQAFFTKKVNEEVNYAYYYYYPEYDSDDECSKSYAQGKLPPNKKELSIGDYETRKESVYYWNLVNSFIPSYYSEYLPTDETEKNKEIIQIADKIYLLYKQIGPSKSCGGNYGGPSVLCPNGVTIEGQGTFELEEYIAGVVSNEAYSSEGIEALKAQAVAARSYALVYTDHCTKTIPNSTNSQTFTRNINDNARLAATSTAGEILIDTDGNIISAMYDSFCYSDSDCPDAKKNADGSYSVTYSKVPNGERHTITLSDSVQYSRIVPGHGHAHGMSQLHSYQLAKQGYTYEQILKFYYSSGVEISLVLSANTTEGATIISSGISNYVNINDMNNYIYSNVRKAGLGTRAGVVAAATSLITGIYTQSGYILPYELLPSGKYTGYGIDPVWGTNTGNSSYPSHGLDCSGFVSWAIHNGGFAYATKSARDWGNAASKTAWSYGTTNKSAQPGDLIYNAPASANGTTGHIRMIIAVTNEGYTIAEASSRQNGVRIKTIPFKSTGNYYLIDMTSYYGSASKVTDYPG